MTVAEVKQPDVFNLFNKVPELLIFYKSSQNKYCYKSKNLQNIITKLLRIQVVLRAYRDARERGVPREHVSIHGDHGGRRLVPDPSGGGQVYRPEH